MPNEDKENFPTEVLQAVLMFSYERPWETQLLFPDWRIKNLLIEGVPVMDTGKSAQLGYEGVMVCSRVDPGSLSTKWPITLRNGKLTSMTTSITWGTGLDLRKEEGRRRAVDWMLQHSKDVPVIPDYGGERFADGHSVMSGIVLGHLVIKLADEVDPEWRERYTQSWWSKQEKKKE